MAGPDLVLIACGAAKAPLGFGETCPARDLYVGPLFTLRRQLAELRDLPWAILSAGYGLLMPGDPTETYDIHLADTTPAYRRVWADRVVRQLRVGDDGRRRWGLDGLVIELHAGRAYRDALVPELERAGVLVHVPDVAQLPMLSQRKALGGLVRVWSQVDRGAVARG